MDIIGPGRGDPLQADLEDLGRHYASLTDDALLALDRAELTEAAQRLYDRELARRGLTAGPERFGDVDEGAATPDPADEAGDAGDELALDAGPAPDWLDDAACACVFAMNPSSAYVSDAAKARAVLRAAGIPCHITVNEADPVDAQSPAAQECCVMVPGALNLHATSVLDQQIFNPKQEADWRAHLAELTDEEICALNADTLCAGFLDRARRLRRAFNEEMARRGLKPRPAGGAISTT